MWPEFVEGRHHKIIGEKFNRIAQGKLKRLIVCLPPRHTKSEFASTYFPAWMMGLRGDLKIIQTTHTAELAVRFGRRVRNIIDSEDYQEVFPSSSFSQTTSQPVGGLQMRAENLLFRCWWSYYWPWRRFAYHR